MKKNLLPICLVTIILLLQSCGYTRIGSLTMISTRNVDSKTEYILIQKNVEGKAKSKHDDALQEAIDNAIRPISDGEFLKNAIIYIKSNGKKIKISGDVWGIPNIKKNVEVSVNTKVELEVGDEVSFKTSDNGKIIFGKIMGINQNNAVVSYTTNPSAGIPAKVKNVEIEFEKLTLIKKHDPNTPVISNDKPQNSGFNTNDCVSFKKNDNEDWINGEITGLNESTAIVEYQDPLTPTRSREIELEYKKLIKVTAEKCGNRSTKTEDVIPLKVGDFVQFKKYDNGTSLKGKVIEINQNMVTVEYSDASDNTKMREIELDIKKLTKAE